MILKYEIRKLIFRKGSIVTLIILLLSTIFNIIVCINLAEWFFENEEDVTGIKAIKIAKEERSKYNGVMTEEFLASVIEKSKTDKFVQLQPVEDITYLLSCSFSPLNDFDYYKCSSLSASQSKQFYRNRIDMIKDWVKNNNEAKFYSEKEKEFLVKSAETLKTPFTYSYMDGWIMIIRHIEDVFLYLFSSLIVIAVPVFVREYQSGMDSILFTTLYGKTKVGRAKVVSVYIVSTIIYWVTVITYTISVLMVYGFDGANSYIQTHIWASYYHLTNLQAYMIKLILGYLTSLVLVNITMLVSSKAKNKFQTVIIPFIILFIPIAIRPKNRILKNIINLFPHNLLDLLEGFRFKYFNLYDIGGHVFTQVQMFFIVYIPIIIITPIIALMFYRRRIER